MHLYFVTKSCLFLLKTFFVFRNVYLAAVGDEIGRVLLLSFTFTVQSRQQQPSLTLLKMLNQSEAHSSTISRIRLIQYKSLNFQFTVKVKIQFRFRPQFDGAAKTIGNSNENSDNKSRYEFATSSNNHIVKLHRLAVCFELT